TVDNVSRYWTPPVESEGKETSITADGQWIRVLNTDSGTTITRSASGNLVEWNFANGTRGSAIADSKGHWHTRQYDADGNLLQPESTISYAQQHNLNVPGNPNALGYLDISTSQGSTTDIYDTTAELNNAYDYDVTALSYKPHSTTTSGKATPGNEYAYKADQLSTLKLYTIESGDTLTEIAERNAITVDELLHANPLIEDKNQIRVGDDLIVPSKEPLSPGSYAGNVDVGEFWRSDHAIVDPSADQPLIELVNTGGTSRFTFNDLFQGEANVPGSYTVDNVSRYWTPPVESEGKETSITADGQWIRVLNTDSGTTITRSVSGNLVEWNFANGTRGSAIADSKGHWHTRQYDADGTLLQPESTINYAQQHNLNVPGNPNALGYLGGLSQEGEEDTLADNEVEYGYSWAGFGPGQQQAVNPVEAYGEKMASDGSDFNSENVVVGRVDWNEVEAEQALNAVIGLTNAVNYGDDLDRLSEGLKLFNRGEDLLDRRGEGFISEQSESRLDAFSSSVNFIDSIDDQNWDRAVVEGVRLAVDVDRLDGTLDYSKDFVTGQTGKRLDAFSSGLSVIDSIDDKNWGQAVKDGMSFAKSIDGLDGNYDFSGNGTGFENASTAVGGLVSAYNLYESLDSGNVGGAIVSGMSLYSAMGGNVASGAAGYVGAVIQLAEGNYAGAALSATSTYLMTMGPYGWAAAAVFTAFGSLAGKPPPPEVWSDFYIDEYGNVSYEMDANKTGDVLKEDFTEYSDAMLEMLDSTEALMKSKGLGGIREDYLHRFGLKENDYYFESQDTNGRIQIRNFVEPKDVYLMMQSLTISEAMVEHGHTEFNPSPFWGDTDWSHSVVGTGEYAGGGNGNGGSNGDGSDYKRGPVYASDEDSKLLGQKPEPLLIRQLQQVQRSWRSDKGLFSGEGGMMLALGLGAGLINFESVFAATGPEQEDASIIDVELYDALLADVEIDNIVIAGYGVLPIGRASPDEAETIIDDDEGFSVEYSAGEHSANIPLASVTLDDPLTLKMISPAAVVPVAEDEPQDEATVDDRWIWRIASSDDIVTPDLDSEYISEDQTQSLRKASGQTDRLSMLEDRHLYTTVDQLLANDKSGSRFIGLGGARHGKVYINDDGEIQFIAEPDYHGSEAGFSYMIEDASGNREEVLVSVIVVNVNDHPQAEEDVITSAGTDASVNLDHLLANDTDIDGDQLRIIGVSRPNQGEIEVSAAGVYRYIPQADASGVVDLVYIVEDTGGLQSVARARIDYGEAAVSENEIHVEHAIIESAETDVYRDLGLLEAVGMSAASLAHDGTPASVREGGNAHAEQAANTTKTTVSEATIGAEPKEKLAQRFEDGLEDEVYRLNAADLAGAGSML
ncbi:MAG: LysM peptidoglycan-binding domain-containing protein, partial [Gammaproteobacteria bacterium]|nr:LysM peptidoglycan-binding domain-containing protein [Gammaproteobacteria bacterium]